MSELTEAALPAARHALPAETGQRIVLNGVSWATYEQLLADFENSHTAHFAYDRGRLEIMILSFKHETLNRTLASIVEVLAEEMSIDILNAGSTTFKRDDLARGFEPDTGFYIRNAERIRGKEEIDLTVDPPPDLVIEIDLTHPSLDKTPIYVAVGVPEVWRYDGKTLTILKLEGEAYREQTASLALPGLTSRVMSCFIKDAQTMKHTAWLHSMREWARSQGGTSSPSQ